MRVATSRYIRGKCLPDKDKGPDWVALKCCATSLSRSWIG